ncbi:MAG TPA: hypothetical protein VIM51_00445 [Desulfosporosinus sp.]
MFDEFREHLMSQNKSQNIIDRHIQSIQDYFTWFSSNSKEETKIRDQGIDEAVSYTIFEGTHNISL